MKYTVQGPNIKSTNLFIILSLKFALLLVPYFYLAIFLLAPSVEETSHLTTQAVQDRCFRADQGYFPIIMAHIVALLLINCLVLDSVAPSI